MTKTSSDELFSDSAKYHRRFSVQLTFPISLSPNKEGISAALVSLTPTRTRRGEPGLRSRHVLRKRRSPSFYEMVLRGLKPCPAPMEGVANKRGTIAETCQFLTVYSCLSSPAMFTHSFGFFAMKYCLWLGVKNREPADLDCYLFTLLIFKNSQ